MKRAAIAIAVLLAGCGGEGTTTVDVRTAAVEKARQQFGLSEDVPLDARVWVGKPYRGKTTSCGTVSSKRGQVPPQRFLATVDPLQWQVFEGAHSPMTSAQPDEFPDWQQYCGVERTAAAPTPTSEDKLCGTRIDANQDGIVQEAEYNSFGFAFDNWDSDNDFSVSIYEFRRCWQAREFQPTANEAFQLFDRNEDGKLGQEEFFAADQFRDFAKLVS